MRHLIRGIGVPTLPPPIRSQNRLCNFGEERRGRGYSRYGGGVETKTGRRVWMGHYHIVSPYFFNLKVVAYGALFVGPPIRLFFDLEIGFGETGGFDT